MNYLKLTTVLRTMKKPEFSRLTDYVHSPFFKVYRPAQLLFDYLAPFYPEFNTGQTKFETIAALGENFDTIKKQETAGVRLLRAVEDFMSLEEWRKNELGNRRYQLKAYQEKGFADEFAKGYAKEIERLDDCPEQNIDTFFNRHLLTELSFNGFDAKLDRSSNNNILPVLESLDAYYAIKKLRYLCEALNRQQFLGISMNGQEKHFENLLEILTPYTNEKYPYVYLFANVCKMMLADTYPDFDLYYQMVKQVAERYGSTDTVNESMGYANNQCSLWFNRGYNEAGNEYLWCIDWRMKHNLLLENGKLAPITFRNIISLAVSIKTEPKAIENLIDVYSAYLPAGQKETYLSFARGLHQYSLRKYVEAVRFLLMAEAKEDSRFNSIIRRWQWICMYESNPVDTELLDNQLIAFEAYLKRNKTEMQPVAKVFQRFIFYASVLVKSGESGIQEADFIQLQNEEYFAGKQWFMEQFILKKRKTRAPSARVKVSVRRG